MKQKDFIAPTINGQIVVIALGQEVVLESYSIHGGENRTKKGKVDKIGNKYFYVGEEKFDVETLQHIDPIWGSGWRLYTSVSAYEEAKEKTAILDELKKFFSVGGAAKDLSIEKLREIENAIYRSE